MQFRGNYRKCIFWNTFLTSMKRGELLVYLAKTKNKLFVPDTPLNYERKILNELPTLTSKEKVHHYVENHIKQNLQRTSAHDHEGRVENCNVNISDDPHEFSSNTIADTFSKVLLSNNTTSLKSGANNYPEDTVENCDNVLGDPYEFLSDKIVDAEADAIIKIPLSNKTTSVETRQRQAKTNNVNFCELSDNSFNASQDSSNDYVPPSYSSESSSNSYLEELQPPSKLNKIIILDDKLLNTEEKSKLKPFIKSIAAHHINDINGNDEMKKTKSEQINASSLIFKNKEGTSDKDLCPFCFEEVGHFSRHLYRKHRDEELVKKIFEMSLNSKNRRNAIIALRKKGNFVLKQQTDELKPVRKPNHYFSVVNIEDRNHKIKEEYFPCVNCLGYYKKSYLWRHKKHCKAKMSEKRNCKNHLTEAQTFLATTGLLGNYLNKSRLKNEVFDIMRPDNISFTVKNDPLICLFGESYLSKHKRKQMNVVVSNKMRELARLKIALQASTTLKGLIDMLIPEMYNKIIAATKIISGYDNETKTFTASSLALHFGTSLKFVCDVAKKAIITKDPLFTHLDAQIKLKEITDLRDIVTHHWTNDIGSLANKAINETKWEKPKLIPLTADVQAFKTYITGMADMAFEKLQKNEGLELNYKLLTECTLALVLLFNRKRIGEVQFLDIKTYECNILATNQEECLSSLTELEKAMSATFKRVVVFGKGSKPVPILFTRRMQDFIAMILKIRKTTPIVPKSNTYIFSNPGSKDRWMSGPSVIRKFAKKCGAKHPELLTSTKFRKQIATILQVLSVDKNEMEQLARFMGHTEKTHAEFYRLTEDVYQTAKIAKVLLLLNAGKGSEFVGKSLAEIEVHDDVLELDDNRKDADIRNDNEAAEQVYQENESNKENENNEKRGDLYDLKFGQENLTTNIQSTSDNSIKKDCNIKGRIRWSTKEKEAIVKFFKKHIATRTAPKKQECLAFIKKNNELYCENDWVRIKTLVYNTYRTK